MPDDVPHAAELAEIFQFLASERKDVAKMAAEGLAAHSLKNKDLVRYVRENPKACSSLLDKLSAAHVFLLGNVLTTLINLASDPEIAEMMSVGQCVARSIRLFDGLERLSDTPNVAALQEMTLMLLNNLTSTHSRCVSDFLQLDDEDLKGYNFGLLKAQYDRQPEVSEGNRSLRPWFLKICLNVTRSGEGQQMLVEDEEWFEAFVGLIADDATPAQLMSLAIKICHHSTAQKPLIARVTAKKLPHAFVHRLSQSSIELDVESWMNMLEAIEMIMGDEVGMQTLEELNAKSALNKFADVTKSKDLRNFVKDNLVPFLDDVQDVYVMNQDE